MQSSFSFGTSVTGRKLEFGQVNCRFVGKTDSLEDATVYS
jgi:hypothetical protein